MSTRTSASISGNCIGTAPLDEKHAFIPYGSRTKASHAPDTNNFGFCRM
jgi:hypothetical protein